MSDYTDKLGKTTASNYSVQPGKIDSSYPAQASGGTSVHDDHSDTPPTKEVKGLDCK